MSYLFSHYITQWVSLFIISALVCSCMAVRTLDSERTFCFSSSHNSRTSDWIHHPHPFSTLVLTYTSRPVAMVSLEAPSSILGHLAVMRGRRNYHRYLFLLFLSTIDQLKHLWRSCTPPCSFSTSWKCPISGFVPPSTRATAADSSSIDRRTILAFST